MSNERTEKATPKRRQKAREEGQVSKSQDLNIAISLAVGFSVIFIYIPFITDRFKDITITTLSDLSPDLVSSGNFVGFVTQYVWSAIGILAPVMMYIMAAGIAINYLQTGVMFSPKSIRPDFSKLGFATVIKNFKKYFQLKSTVELSKAVVKSSIIAAIGYSVIKKRETEIAALLGADLSICMKVLSGTLFEMLSQICILLFVLGLIDKKYQDYEFEKSIKMTKQEIKDEHKNMEGDPKIKSKIRSAQMRFATQRMMSAVPSADVIVTNPTHYAVALRYDTSKSPAPQVVAKGVDYIAFKIREVAENNNIPIVENKPLARTLYEIVPLDGVIPAELYVAVAEVLAYVYRSGKGKGKSL